MKVWPVKVDGEFVAFDTDVGTTSKAVTITDVKDWEAVPIQPLSPMRLACHKEFNDVGIFNANTARLKSSSDYGRLPITARKTSVARPLLQVNARHGFYNLPVAFLAKLAAYLDVATLGKDLFSLLSALLVAIIPAVELTDELFISILDLRSAAFEFDEDLKAITSVEYILDCFDKMERVTLEQEIKNAKASKSDRED